MRALLSIIVMFALAPAAHAQSASAQAEVLFRQGRELMKVGKYADACAAFEASGKLDPAATTLLNLGDCREKNGQLASALAEFSNAEKLAKESTNAKTKALAKVAASHITKLEHRLSKLTIQVAADRRIAGLAITRNGEPVDATTWNVALPLDGGTYKIEAHAPGRDDWQTTVTVRAEGDAPVVEVPALKEHAGARPVATTVGAAPGQPPAPAPLPARPAPVATSGGSKLPLALGIGSVALLGGAVAFDLWGNSTYDKAKTDPDPNKQLDYWHSANTKRYVAEGMLGAAVATAGVATWMWLHDRERTDVVVPVVAGGAAGLVFSGQW